MKISSNSIQTRLTLALAGLVIVALLLLGVASYWQAKGALSDSVDETGYALADYYALQTEMFTKEAILRLEDLASIQRMRESEDNAALIASLAETDKRLKLFEMLSYVRPDGSSLRMDGKSDSLGDRPYFKKVLETKKSYVSDMIVSRSTGKLSVVIAVPVFNKDGGLKAVLAGTMSLEKLNEVLKQVKFKDTGYAFLADDSGMVLAHPKRPELAGKLNVAKKEVNPELKLPSSTLDDRMIQLFKTALEKNDGVRGDYTFVDGITRMAIYQPIELAGGQRWMIMITAPLDEANAEVRHLTYIMLGLSVFCLLLAIGIAAVISKRFVAPILTLRDAAEHIAAGDLRSQEVAVQSQDELGQLAGSFADMSGKLRDLVVQVQRESQQVAAASEELTASAEQAAHAVQQVAGSVTEVAGGADRQLSVAREATTEVDALAKELAGASKRASEVQKSVAKTSQAAESGGEAIGKAIRQMQALDTTVTHSAQVVAKLGERSQEIGQIVDTISGIAGQTNLLALNAAIEAARAGEQGRGFAVVADEVRKLAEQSQEAAGRIASLIGEIQGETGRAVEAMNKGTAEVKEGTVVAGQAGAAFEEIVGLIRKANEEVAAITTAIEQTVSGSGRIVHAVDDMQNVSRDTAEQTQTVAAATEEQAASMEEIASSSRSLALLAEELQVAVSRFKV
ncbi:methyl-accepting chemotaxis protein [Anaeroarcus burkinensis]|uniref:methyl-accepting chemotaxis protein n=1 Tax=Anaeroarcus burkinensis TaxID=82376 RepID=UPI0004280D58|nr:methyl-accepting chemotaxis protein [Anaeroarcus burkinensis]